jgi:hypothetical protein
MVTSRGSQVDRGIAAAAAHVWSIRTKLQIEGRARDLAMFNLAIDSKLRGCDVVAIRVGDVAAGGYTANLSCNGPAKETRAACQI